MTTDYRSVSFWHETAPEPAEPRPSLPGDTDADVVIVGAGFTGLWTAYYLAKADPSLRVAVVERDIAGFGASGRNGGWCVGELAATLPVVDREAGRDAAIAMSRAMHETVDDVGKVAADEGIDCHFAKGGSVNFATNRAQLGRLERLHATMSRYGFGDEDYQMLSAREATSIVNATSVHGGLYSAHVAALHPGRLVRGLAAAVERAGVSVYEQTPVEAIEPRSVVTPGGRVRAEVVVRATEAYTASIRGQDRTFLPIGNHMIVTEPLPQSAWDEIGLARRETFEDTRHLIFYGQRTVDDRIAIGGLTIPYRFRSGVDPSARDANVYERLRRLLGELFPVLRDVTVTHRWGGVLGAPRGSFPSVGYDRATGFAWAGGYVGVGVAAADLGGRTVADLVVGTDTDRTRLPWVGHRSPDWEPEPWRWLEFHVLSSTLAVADRLEGMGIRARWADKVLSLIAG